MQPLQSVVIFFYEITKSVVKVKKIYSIIVNNYSIKIILFEKIIYKFFFIIFASILETEILLINPVFENHSKISLIWPQGTCTRTSTLYGTLRVPAYRSFVEDVGVIASK